MSKKSVTLNGYETTYIFSPEVADDLQQSFAEKLKGIVAQHSGAVVHTENWGRRRFAYPINKETRGSYYYMVYTGDSELVAEIERNMRINESILRFLTIGLGKDFKASEYKKKSPNAAGEKTAPQAVAAE